MSINALKRIRPGSLKYEGNIIRYDGKEARDEWAHVLAFATSLTRFEYQPDGWYTHAVTVTVDGMDEPVSVLLRLA